VPEDKFVLYYEYGVRLTINTIWQVLAVTHRATEQKEPGALSVSPGLHSPGWDGMDAGCHCDMAAPVGEAGCPHLMPSHRGTLNSSVLSALVPLAGK
jgi:hypothetical protein